MSDQTTIHRYPPRALRGAWARVVLGVVLAAGLGLASHEIIVLSVIAVTILLAFLAYGARTYVRGTSTVIADTDGLRVAGPRPSALEWKHLTGLRLAYYTTRRDGENGWMELSVRGRDGRITLDSDIDGFSAIAARAMAAAEEARLDLAPSTRRNFEAVITGTAPITANSRRGTR